MSLATLTLAPTMAKPLWTESLVPVEMAMMFEPDDSNFSRLLSSKPKFKPTVQCLPWHSDRNSLVSFNSFWV